MHEMHKILREMISLSEKTFDIGNCNFLHTDNGGSVVHYYEGKSRLQCYSVGDDEYRINCAQKVGDSEKFLNFTVNGEQLKNIIELFNIALKSRG